jgi:prophage regulatory protein
MEHTSKRVLRVEDACIKAGISRSMLYDLASRNEFPAPIKLGAKASGWIESEIDAWIDARIAARDAK